MAKRQQNSLPKLIKEANISNLELLEQQIQANSAKKI